MASAKRYITTHDSSGTAVFHTGHGEEAPVTMDAPFGTVQLLYTATPFPPNTANDADLEKYKYYTENPPGVKIPGGTGVAIVNMKPGASSPMHRTVSVDTDTVIEGEVELTLDSGETRIMRPGDTVVMRGTMHMWRNVTPNNGTARLIAISHEMVPIEIDGKELGEDWTGKVPT